MSDKKTFIEKAIKSAIGNSRYLVVVNGLIEKKGSLPLHVKVENDRLVFYTKSKEGGIFLELETENHGARVMETLASSTLFGYDFSNWSEQWSQQRGRYYIGVRANPSLRILFLESDMYRLFKDTVPRHHNVTQFIPQINEGRELTASELVDLTLKFRMNGFDSLLDLMNPRLYNAIRRNSRGIYRVVEGSFFPAMVRSEDFFNPFYDDVQIHATVKDRKLFQYISKDMQTVRNIDLSAAHLTSRQVSEALNLGERVPMNFEIMLRLVVGMIMPPNVLPATYPHKSNVMYRLNVLDEAENYDRYVTEQEYEQLGEYGRSLYVKSTTYNSFLLRNLNFFRRHGFSGAQHLLDVMRQAVLV